MVSCIYFTILPIYLCTLRSEGNKIYYIIIIIYYIIRKGVKNSSMRYLPKLLFSSIFLAHKHFSNMVPGLGPIT